ncbi:hypothetical protein I315_00057 [Cryptococcus gattii Ru294]|nr:hypothetical protein I315_00057 [Cryptococcus gattii Ru294]KJE03515.1 hypothetical protein I311_02815 [Cryptococcus gattii NT-10]
MPHTLWPSEGRGSVERRLSLAHLEWLFAEIAGDDASIGLLYDVACKFEAHLRKRM